MNEIDTIDVGDAIVAGVVGNFLRIPEYLYTDQSLDMADMFTYAVLLKYAGVGKKKGLGAIPSIKRIAIESRSSEASVKRRIGRLKERGWITVRRRGLSDSNSYKVYGPHPKCPSLGSGVDMETLQRELATAQIELSEGHAIAQNELSVGLKMSYQESSNCATSNRSVVEKSNNPPIVPQGTEDTDSSLDNEIAPIPLTHRRQRGESRYQREADDAYWTAEGEDGEAMRKRFAAIWKAHPRQEDRQGAMRAWRVTLGTTPLHEGAMRLIWYLHKNAKQMWAERSSDMVPKLDTWLSRREWEDHETWPAIEQQIAQGWRCRDGDPDFIPTLPASPPPLATPPRTGFKTQADLNAPARNPDGSVKLRL